MARTELWANPHVGQGIGHRGHRGHGVHGTGNGQEEGSGAGRGDHRKSSSRNLSASERPSAALASIAASRRAHSSREKIDT